MVSTQATAPTAVQAQTEETAQQATARAAKTIYVWAALRIVMGITFLWAFVDKVFGLGYATEAGKGWIDGGSPTFGFLNFGAAGPLAGFYQAIAGNAVTDVLFMAGLAGVGLAMLLGIGTRIGGYAGALIYMLIWSAALPKEHNLFLVDEHIIGALVLVGLAVVPAGRTWGLGNQWRRLKLVQKYRILV